jgi:hypothetical protein
LNLIQQQISRQPGEKLGYDSLRQLADTSVSGAAETLRDFLLHRAPDKMPAAVGMDLVTLVKARPLLAAVLQPAVEHLERSNTRIGRAVQSALKAK